MKIYTKDTVFEFDINENKHITESVAPKPSTSTAVELEFLTTYTTKEQI